tara:strand:+ start:53 stop:1402 length:1350 start_codon:yes stop_codon:yes gene_type:complete
MRILIIYILFQLILCNQDTLILVSNKVITKNDFMRRAEYSIRPGYCKSNEDIDKKIILNSLIAEKLFAIENLEDTLINKKTSNFINGIKEQMMRKLMLEEHINKNLHIDDSSINNLYSQSQFEYQINFITLKPHQIKKIDTQETFEEISQKLNIVPSSKNITFFTCSNNTVWNFFYNQNVIKNGDLIGPLSLSSNDLIMIKVLKKKRNIIIGADNQKRYYSEVKKHYIEFESSKIRADFISNIMSKKKLEFRKKSFINFANYYQDKSNTTINFQDVLFQINGQNWTIKDVQDIIKSRPILFRDSYSNEEDFYQEFKLALVDVIRDYFITNKAYEENYENHITVINEIDIWLDYALAVDKKNKVLNNNINSKKYSNDYDLIENIIKPEMEILFNKYSEEIIVDVDMLDNIKLSSIDMIGTNIKKPYQLIVPPFPMLTTKNKINYGVKKPI